VRAVSRNLNPVCGRFGNGDHRGFEQDEFQVRNGPRTALKPVERDRILILASADGRTRTMGISGCREMRMGNGNLPGVHSPDVIGILLPVLMQEGRRKHGRGEGQQNLDGGVTAHW
jgi:hypothetical protein